jgi:3-oxoacyl-[acyl-carrier protein] reductase
MTALQDKTALVTGASPGIGRATAVALAAAGARAWSSLYLFLPT